MANTHELKRRQETPDAPEALSCVPALKLSDIPKSVTKVCFNVFFSNCLCACVEAVRHTQSVTEMLCVCLCICVVRKNVRTCAYKASMHAFLCASMQVPTDMSSRQGATILTHDMFTNNVVYMEAVMDMKNVPLSLLPLIPLFCRSLTNMATEVRLCFLLFVCV